MIWKDAKESDHVSFNGCPGICLERMRTSIGTSVMTICVPKGFVTGVCRMQVTTVLSYDKLLGQKDEKEI
jgi:hypothetical protein